MLLASSSVLPSLLVFLVISLPARSTKLILPCLVMYTPCSIKFSLVALTHCSSRCCPRWTPSPRCVCGRSGWCDCDCCGRSCCEFLSPDSWDPPDHETLTSFSSFPWHNLTSSTATRSSSSPHSMLNRLSTTKARDLLFHRTVRLDRLAPGFSKSIT